MLQFERRVKDVEATIGVSLPPEHVRFLREGPPSLDEPVGVPFRGEVWDISYFFRLDDGPNHKQLDKTCRLVSDVLPEHALPVAEDHAGNFFCLFVAGPNAGRIVWWDHERDLGDDHVEDVAPSLATFLTALRPREE